MHGLTTDCHTQKVAIDITTAVRLIQACLHAIIFISVNSEHNLLVYHNPTIELNGPYIYR